LPRRKFIEAHLRLEASRRRKSGTGIVTRIVAVREQVSFTARTFDDLRG